MTEYQEMPHEIEAKKQELEHRIAVAVLMRTGFWIDKL